ncbi:type II toxin-antitoxin system RelE/ParE family toxin [Spirosoma validum]|uniref:Type II toxin-antitoxin system RelE/ParE family toxin n=1 Tax=Spirosoma validum TaxID=2771355 RepID=A0A927B1L0_9BACT|nr:type II toxin-antitoxin system RelE/ParE family toxin [Spirosoma validum]MBD2753648.1 type II toxin-antitoxin system RelE/ParE family toxin [Spirosoma validum]
MSYSILTLSVFDKQLKRLARKYPSIKADLAQLAEELLANPTLGKSLGSNFYKVRLKITSKRTGKAGGARVITYVKLVNATITLSFIYDKAERSTVSEDELDSLLTLLEDS